MMRETFRQRAGNVGIEAAWSMGLGGGGEALGQFWRDPGEKLDWDAIAAEMVAEVAGPSSFGVMRPLAMTNGLSPFNACSNKDRANRQADRVSAKQT